MDSKPFGSTEVQVSEIGLGTYGYGGGPAALRRGIELGANHIDTAEMYDTEEAVGEAISGIRDRVFLATKVSGPHFRRDDLIKAAEGSLRRLGTDYVDLYQLHWPNSDIPIEETMSAMNRLVDDGKVLFIGVSNFSVQQFEEAQAVSNHRIASNQVVYSLISRGIEDELLPFCEAHDVTVIAYSPLAQDMGKLRDGLKGRVLERVATETGRTEAQVALNWCISHQGVVTIPKSSSVQRTEENCDASGWRLSEDHLRLLDGAGR